MKKNPKSLTPQVSSIELSEAEYNYHLSLTDFFDNTRNNLLTFTFTAVLTLISIVFSFNTVSPYICLGAYLLIIPFTARITYYRLASAHVNSFLRCFAPDRNIFRVGSSIVREKQGVMYPIIAWLVNHEMFILSIAVGLVYIYQYLFTKNISSWIDFILLFLPIFPIILVYAITDSTNSYIRLYNHYIPQWSEYRTKMQLVHDVNTQFKQSLGITFSFNIEHDIDIEDSVPFAETEDGLIFYTQKGNETTVFMTQRDNNTLNPFPIAANIIDFIRILITIINPNILLSFHEGHEKFDSEILYVTTNASSSQTDSINKLKEMFSVDSYPDIYTYLNKLNNKDCRN